MEFNLFALLLLPVLLSGTFFNLTNTTTINFNGTSNSIILGNQKINSGVLDIISVILLIFMGLCVGENQPIGYCLALVLLYCIGILDINILVLAFFITAILIVYEFTHKKEGII